MSSKTVQPIFYLSSRKAYVRELVPGRPDHLTVRDVPADTEFRVSYFEHLADGRRGWKVAILRIRPGQAVCLRHFDVQGEKLHAIRYEIIRCPGSGESISKWWNPKDLLPPNDEVGCLSWVPDVSSVGLCHCA